MSESSVVLDYFSGGLQETSSLRARVLELERENESLHRQLRCESVTRKFTLSSVISSHDLGCGRVGGDGSGQ